jgi:DNA repair protein RecO (recombination protein O)
MQLSFEAIVLSAVKYGENSAIACILTENHGIYKGLVRSITGAAQRGLYQPGNVIEAIWRARLSEHLGNLTAGLLHAGGACAMGEPLKLAALSSICSILESTLQERDPAPTIYQHLRLFLTQLGSENDIWQQSYILLELELLAQLGFGLELSSCAASGAVEDLIYVSPKSGRAVCREAGLPYHDKLLRLPEFILESINNQASADFLLPTAI